MMYIFKFHICQNKKVYVYFGIMKQYNIFAIKIQKCLIESVLKEAKHVIRLLIKRSKC